MAIEASPRQALRIRVGRLIDGTDAPAVVDAALLVVDDRIVQVGPESSVDSPEDARTLQYPDATALPGLMDAHVHLALPPTVDPLGTLGIEADDDLVVRGVVAAERMVRAGITTAYDCGERGMVAYGIRDAIAKGRTLGPRLLVSGRPVTQTKGHCYFFGGEADGVDGVREAVRRLLEDEGADGIKIMSTGGGLTPGTDSRFGSYSIPELAAAADEAHRFGKRITCHAHGVPISVDARRPAVMRAATDAGAAMINDVFALRAAGAIETAASSGAAVCIMHMQGEPATMQQSPRYRDVVSEVCEFLRDRANACLGAGIAAERIVVDPGFGFGTAAAEMKRALSIP